MIIVSGKIYTSSENREAFLKSSYQSMMEARQTAGCRDFVVAADPIEANRVNIYEEWDSEMELESFRGQGPEADLTALIVSAEVSQHHIL